MWVTWAPKYMYPIRFARTKLIYLKSLIKKKCFSSCASFVVQRIKPCLPSSSSCGVHPEMPQCKGEERFLADGGEKSRRCEQPIDGNHTGFCARHKPQGMPDAGELACFISRPVHTIARASSVHQQNTLYTFCHPSVM